MPEARIQIVEDETIVAMDIERGLKRLGYRVVGMAGTGPDAIHLAQQQRPELVLMDIRLQGEMDGIEAGRQIRQRFHIPILFLTAYADEGAVHRAKVAEPFGYLLKPFEDEELHTAIEIALHKRQVEQSALNQAGRIFSWSAGAERIHGWCAGEVLGKHVSLLYPDEENARRKPEQDLEAALRAGRHLQYGNQMRKDTSCFSAHMIQVPLQDTVGSVAGYLQVTREVTPGGMHN